jgi:hypothetical protein
VVTGILAQNRYWVPSRTYFSGNGVLDLFDPVEPREAAA